METTHGISEGNAVYKVAGGKMIKVRARFAGDVIEDIRISGDFFLHPEEVIEDVERALRGVRIHEVEKAVADALRGVECVGVSPSDFCTAIRMAHEARK
jgi:lipoate-protein ligase A